jgi:hypothetical protein
MKCNDHNCKREGKNYGTFAGLTLTYCDEHAQTLQKFLNDFTKNKPYTFNQQQKQNFLTATQILEEVDEVVRKWKEEHEQ